MSEITDVDEAQWRTVRAWLANDPKGQKILGAFATDPGAGSVALRRLLRERGAPGVTNQISDSDIEKFVTLAHADQVYFGDHTVNVDRSYHYTTLDLDPVANSSGFPRFLIIFGTLVSLAGFAVALIGMFTFFQSTSSAFSQGPQVTPPSIGFPPTLFIGFGIFFVGLVITIVGVLFRKSKAPPPVRR